MERKRTESHKNENDKAFNSLDLKMCVIWATGLSFLGGEGVPLFYNSEKPLFKSEEVMENKKFWWIWSYKFALLEAMKESDTWRPKQDLIVYLY